MNNGFTYTFPAKIGATVYVINGEGFVHKNKVEAYIIRGNTDHNCRVKLSYVDKNGAKCERYRALNLFGRTIFKTTREAEEAARAME
jgi:hypothetical protein